MKIELLSKYKSLSPFISDELNDFTAIIGANGSGKTQLLDAISENNKEQCAFITHDQVINIQLNGIDLYDINEVNGNNLTEIKKSFHSDYRNIPVDMLPFLEYLYKKNLLKDIFFKILPTVEQCSYSNKNHSEYFNNTNNFVLLDDSDEYLKLVEKTYNNVLQTDDLSGLGINFIDKHDWILLQSHIHNIQGKEFYLLLLLLGSRFKKKDYIKHSLKLNHSIYNLMDVVFNVATLNNKRIGELELNDFLLININPKNLENNLFHKNIEYIFFTYAKKRDDNDHSFFRKERYQDINDSIDDQEFIEKNPKPWDILNSILDKYQINFYFKGLESKEFNNDITHKPYLYKKGTHEEIDYVDLSSGEKIIIGLILVLFNTEFYDEKLQFPDLILLDEPDAHLHPEMTKMLIDILKDVFVKQFNIKVIMSTHNPSTIALLDDDSIYQMTNGEETSLKKINKDNALKLLTGFIPTLTIDYRNHRQVFVESPTDVEYYQTVYNKLSQVIKFDYKLYFMSCAYGEGNCEQVVKVVNDFQYAGVQTVFGVIDWDLKNNNKGNVKVHGCDSRYSIENYLCDPLYVSILFIDENFYDFAKELDYYHNSPYSLPQNKIKAQQAVDLFFDKLCKDDEELKSKYKEKIEVCYGNDLKLQLPANFLREKGHNFVNLIRDKFSSLNKYNNDKKLEKKMTNIIARCYPYIPQDTLDLIYDLAVISTDE